MGRTQRKPAGIRADNGGPASALGGLSDADPAEARGSDTLGQNLEIDGDVTEETGKRKRQSIEGDLGAGDESDRRPA